MSKVLFFAVFVFSVLPVFGQGEAPVAETVNGGTTEAKPAPDVVKAAVAGGYVDQVKTVEGKVVKASFIPKINGHPTFIDLEKSHPNSVFTVVVWGSHRKKFAEKLEKALPGKIIRVTGKIVMHKDTPQMVVASPTQIQVLGEDGFKEMAAAPEKSQTEPTETEE